MATEEKKSGANGSSIITGVTDPKLKFLTLNEILQSRVAETPDKVFYTFLKNDEENNLDYRTLDLNARTIAAKLQQLGKKGDRVLLIYPAGIDYISAFFGALYARFIAVPCYHPELNSPIQTLLRLESIIQNSEATIALTNSTIYAQLQVFLSDSEEARAMQNAARTNNEFLTVIRILRSVQWVITDTISGDIASEWKHPKVSTNDIAFLQYTSGSTGSPKGVILKHSNLLHNIRLITRCFEIDSPLVAAGWLPLYHDMGLIGLFLTAFYDNCHYYMMSPFAFVQKPIRWLEVISKYKAVISGGPDFAYDLCIQKVTEEEKKRLDLSSWTLAFNGSEPVRGNTLDRFAEAFRCCGFKKESLYPCYGMAEATLFVSGGWKSEAPKTILLEEEALKQHKIVLANEATQDYRKLVSVGHNWSDQKLIIVNPHTKAICQANEIGELWISGPSVSDGYWKNNIANMDFHAYTSDTGDGPYYRTGDMGFVMDKELYITGRLKDLIIINGMNYYPHDIESALVSSHESLKSGCGAAFSVEADGKEKLVIVQEVKKQFLKHLNIDELGKAIQQTISATFKLNLHQIVFTKTIPKTSSGKIQRKTVKEAFLKNELENLGAWPLRQTDAESAARPATAISVSTVKAIQRNELTTQAVENWLVRNIADLLKTDHSAIKITEPFNSFGINSVMAVQLATNLGEWVGKELPITLLYDYPDIERLAKYICNGDAGKIDSATPVQDDFIAVIGMGCRLPGANNTKEFWSLLVNGQSAIRKIPAERIDKNWKLVPEEHTFMHRAGFLDKVADFDPLFFGISPREANAIDPQQRLMLEVCWETLENAGIPGDHLKGQKVGVFVGASSHDYSDLHFLNIKKVDAYFALGNASSIIANRLSYFLDLRGPSLTVDTACSSSLTAIHYACNSIRNQECTMALAGGVNLIITPVLSEVFKEAGMISHDATCKVFDEKANGYVRGEGCGLILLKSYNEALKDGNRILAIIRGSAVNQDGRSNGITAPNRVAQEEVIREALRNARVAPQQIGYVETHGTGTSLGDPIEVSALTSVLSKNREPQNICYLGAVKTQIGHLEAAAGIAGVLKTIMVLKNKYIPQNLHFEQLNPAIHLNGSGLQVAERGIAWQSDSNQYYAGISSFGFGGTNAHLIMEAAEEHEVKPEPISRPVYLIKISARTRESLLEYCQSYIKYLKQEQQVDMGALSYSSNTARSDFEHRLAFVCSSPEELLKQLENYLLGRKDKNIYENVVLQNQQGPVFLFSGQGAQHPHMCKELYEVCPTFRREMDKCFQIIEKIIGQPITELLSDNSKTYLQQAHLFAVEYSLYQLWRSWGIEPSTVLGHSFGEYVAACVAGVFSLEDGLLLVLERGRLMELEKGHGKMLQVYAGADVIAPLIADFKQSVSIAAINTFNSVIVSGACAVMDLVFEQLHVRGIKGIWYDELNAFHSPVMQQVAHKFKEVAEKVSYHSPKIPFISCVTGKFADNEVANADHWCRHILEPVNFQQGMQTLHEQDAACFIEIGNKAALIPMAISAAPEKELLWVPSLRAGKPDWLCMMQAVANLYTQGIKLNWQGIESEFGHSLIDLPMYPFRRHTFWLKEEQDNAQTIPSYNRSVADVNSSNLFMGKRFYSPLLKENEWGFEMHVNAGKQPFLKDHQIFHTVILPASGYLEIVLSASRQVYPNAQVVLSEIKFNQVMTLQDNGEQVVQLLVQKHDDKKEQFKIFSYRAEEEQPSWKLNAEGALRITEKKSDAFTPSLQDIKRSFAQSEETNTAEFYKQLHDHGMQYGPHFRAVKQLWKKEGEALGLVHYPQESGNGTHAHAYTVHPALLDASLQVVAAAINDTSDLDAYLPISIEHLTVHCAVHSKVWSIARLRTDPTKTAKLNMRVANVFIYNDSGELAISVEGFLVRRTSRENIKRIINTDLANIFYQTVWQPSAAMRKPEVKERSQWILFCDNGGVGRKLEQALTALNHDVKLVFPGNEFKWSTGENTVHIRPHQPEDYEALFSNITLNIPAKLIYLWSLNMNEPADAMHSLADEQTFYFDSIKNILQQIERTSIKGAAKLWLITNNAVAVSQHEAALHPIQSPVWGFSKSIAIEHPAHWGGIIDLDESAMEHPQTIIHHAWPSNQANHYAMAIRNGNIFTPHLKPANLQSASPLVFSPNHTYLVTGGTGGIGKQLVEWLASKGAKHIAVIARNTPTDETLNAFASLKNDKVQLEFYTADVSSADDMRRAFEKMQSNMPPLKGVFHAAGSISLKHIPALDAETSGQVLNPKTSGSWILHELTKTLELDCFVLCSSIASVWGSRKLAHYAAANHFLDTLAHYRRASGLPAVSINWGPWQGSGMLSAEYKSSLDSAGIRALEPNQYLRALELILKNQLPQVAVVSVEWNLFKDVFSAHLDFFKYVKSKNRRTEVRAEQNHRTGLVDNIKKEPADKGYQLMVDYLREVISEVLSVDKSDINIYLFLIPMGLDSLMAARIRNIIQRDLRIELDLSCFMDDLNIHMLAEELVAKLKNEMKEESTATIAEEGTHSLMVLPLSAGQKALWLTHQYAPQSPAYNISFSARIFSTLDIERLKIALERVANRHIPLKSNYDLNGNSPYQFVQGKPKVHFELIDATALSDTQLREAVEHAYRQPFDLLAGPVMRLHLFQCASDHYVLLLVIHHISADAWSLKIIMDELEFFYSGKINGHGSTSLPALTKSYYDFILQEMETLKGPKRKELEEYWKNQLAGVPGELSLPIDKNRPKVASLNGASLSFRIDKQSVEALKKFSKESGYTNYHILFAVYQALLHRYSTQNHFVVGTTLANRSDQSFEKLVGFFVNMLPIKTEINTGLTFNELVQQTRKNIIGAFSHKDIPFQHLLEILKVKRDPSRLPLVQATFSYLKVAKEDRILQLIQPEKETQVEWAGLFMSPYAIKQQEGQFEVVLNFVEDAETLVGTLKYNSDLFEAATIERMTQHFSMLLAQFLANPQSNVSTVRFITHGEEQMINEWNNTLESVAGDGECIHRLFEQQVQLHPEKTALFFDGRQFSYDVLNKEANRVAHYLIKKGIGPETCVGILLPRSPAALISLLGIMKAGGAYVPIDPDFPKAHIEYIVGHADIRVLMTERKLADQFQFSSPVMVCIDEPFEEDDEYSDTNPDVAVDESTLAYIIYTSGTTGTPKGIAVEHRHLLNHVQGIRKRLSLTGEESFAVLTTLSADSVYTAVFSALLWGGVLHIVPEIITKDSSLLIHYLAQNKISCYKITPSFLHILLTVAKSGDFLPKKHLLIGGEPLSKGTFQLLQQFNPVCEVYNHYGPTETAIGVLMNLLNASECAELPETLPIGTPMLNTTAYIVDENMEKVPVGSVGELIIGGRSVARGYYKNETLTEKAFIPDPFIGISGSRMYRTGDMARYLPDGKIQFLGRMDRQVKLRGYRIEMNAIENTLCQFPGIQQAVVMLAENGVAKKHLVAYVASEPGIKISFSELKEHIGRQLPPYMVPAVFINIDSIPLKINGKIDYSGLPSAAISRTYLDVDYTPARNETEEQLIDIWKKILGTDKIGVNDSLFDLGADSLKVTLAAAQITEQFKIKLEMAKFFEFPTVAGIANYIEKYKTLVQQLQTTEEKVFEEREEFNF